MFYKGYRIHFIIAALLAVFITGYFLQTSYVNKQLTEFERLNTFLYRHLLVNSFEEIANNEEIGTLYEQSPTVVFSMLDSIAFSHYRTCYHTENISYIFTNEEDSVLYSSQNYKTTRGFPLINPLPELIEVASVVLSNNKILKIKIPDNISSRNQNILWLFKLLWILLCVVTLGFIIYNWEKQKIMQRIRMDVLNNMSHEFKTPLTSIQLISEMLQQQGGAIQEEKIKKYASIIHQECNKMLKQTSQLLNTAYYEHTSFLLRNRNHNIHGLINFILGSYTVVFGENELKVSTNYKANKYIAKIDRTHFINVITNLLDNARKYSKSEASDVCISTYNESGKLIIEVSDNGIGIDSKYHKYIFDRFYRVPSGNLHNRKGYGVGLYYVKSVLKKMDTDIRVKSRLDQGTTFILQIKSIKHIAQTLKKNNYDKK